MYKGIASKAIVPVTLAVTGFVVLGCLLLHSYIRNDLIANTIRHETGLADTIIKSTRYAMLKTDREMLQQAIRDIGAQPGVEHVRIFNKKGIVMFSSAPGEISRSVDKQAAGCNGCHRGKTPATRLGPMEQARRFTNGHGKEVLAITAPIYNDESCAAAGCHQSVARANVLGTLDIGFSIVPLQESLAQLRTRMALFCVMVLFLTVGGVCALLRRNVLMPIHELVLYAEDMVAGRLEQIPPSGSEEIEELAACLRRLAVDRLEAGADALAQRPERDHAQVVPPVPPG